MMVLIKTGFQKRKNNYKKNRDWSFEGRARTTLREASIHEVKNKISYRENSEFTNDIDDGEVETFLVKENGKAVDLLCEATRMHEILAKSLWHSKL